MSESLVAFLRARLDEDWEVAQRENTYPHGKPISAEAWDRVAGAADSMLVSMFSPPRVLAEVQAKRQIVALYDEVAEHDGTRTDASHPDAVRAEVLGEVVRLLALPDADHPDYREEWKP